jgi:hypothetical protein
LPVAPTGDADVATETFEMNVVISEIIVWVIEFG